MPGPGSSYPPPSTYSRCALPLAPIDIDMDRVAVLRVVERSIVWREGDVQRRSGIVAVLVVDDHEMFADGVGTMIGRAKDMHLVGVAASTADGLVAAQEHRPDVALMDWRLPDGDGESALKAIHDYVPQTQVLLR